MIMPLTNQEQIILYEIWLNDHLGKTTVCNGEYNRIEKLHKLGLIRKVKMKRSKQNKLQLTDEGIIYGIILAREKGERKLNRHISVLFL